MSATQGGREPGTEPDDGPGRGFEVTVHPPPERGEVVLRRGDRALLVAAAAAALLAAATGAVSLVQQRGQQERAALHGASAEYLGRSGALLDALARVDHCAADLPRTPAVREAFDREVAHRTAGARLALLSGPAVRQRVQAADAALEEELDRLYAQVQAPPAATADPGREPAPCEVEGLGRHIGVWNARLQLERVAEVVREGGAGR
ncbi:hypothetical protein NUM3379_20250 [Kineococcus sp. NUM-3379]